MWDVSPDLSFPLKISIACKDNQVTWTTLCTKLIWMDMPIILCPLSTVIGGFNYHNIQVMILEKSGDGWWRGQYGNKVASHPICWSALAKTNPEVFFKSTQLSQVGWFPSNYTQEEIDDPHTYCMAENVLDVMVRLFFVIKCSLESYHTVCFDKWIN